jgi:hypothetical protein
MGSIIHKWVGVSWYMVMARHIAVKMLMDPLQAKKVWGHFVGSLAAFPVPVEGCQVICLAEDGVLMDVIGLAEDIKMKWPSHKFYV